MHFSTMEYILLSQLLYFHDRESFIKNWCNRLHHKWILEHVNHILAIVQICNSNCDCQVSNRFYISETMDKIYKVINLHYKWCALKFSEIRHSMFLKLDTHFPLRTFVWNTGLSSQNSSTMNHLLLHWLVQNVYLRHGIMSLFI